MAALTQVNVLLIIFPGFNTLDANGPLEMFRKSGQSQIFTVTVASETEHTTSVEGCIMKRHIPLDEALISALSDYELLVVAGGGPTEVKKQASTSGLFMSLVQSYASLTPASEQPPRTLLSICTAAIFLGTLGIFNGRPCTTHWGAYSTLVQVNNQAAASTQPPSQPGQVLPARYVDSGPNASGVRIISSGGISCGLDASLHVITMIAGEDEARETAKLLDYRWQTTDGVSFGVDFS